MLSTYHFRLSVPVAEFAAARDKFIAIPRTLPDSQTQGIGGSSSQTPTDGELSAPLQKILSALIAKANQRATLFAEAMPAALGPNTALSTPSIVPGPSIVTFSLTPPL